MKPIPTRDAKRATAGILSPFELEGRRYSGFYTVSSGVVTVESDWGERSAQAGARAEETARLLLLEILRRSRVPVMLPSPCNALVVERLNYEPEEYRD